MLEYIKFNWIAFTALVISVFAFFRSWSDSSWARSKDKSEIEPRFYCEYNKNDDQWTFTNIGANCNDLAAKLSSRSIEYIKFSKIVNRDQSIILRLMFDKRDPILSMEYFIRTKSRLKLELSFANRVNERYRQTFAFTFGGKDDPGIVIGSDPEIFKKRK